MQSPKSSMRKRSAAVETRTRDLWRERLTHQFKSIVAHKSFLRVREIISTAKFDPYDPSHSVDNLSTHKKNPCTCLEHFTVAYYPSFAPGVGVRGESPLGAREQQPALRGRLVSERGLGCACGGDPASRCDRTARPCTWYNRGGRYLI